MPLQWNETGGSAAEGLLAISWRDKLQVSDGDMQDEEGLAGLFTEAERKAYEDARTYKIMKNRISLDNPELQAPIHALLEFFDNMNQWERMAEQKVTAARRILMRCLPDR